MSPSTEDGLDSSDGGTAVSVLPIADPLTATDRFFDLSKLLVWGGYPAETSAFEIVEYGGRMALTLRRGEPVDTADQVGIGNSEGLRGHSAIDYDFGAPIDRTTTTLTIEFDAAWEQINNSGGGEGGKFHFIVLHDYPEGGPQPGQVDQLIGNPYGRPAYTLVIRNTSNGSNNAPPFLFYGGGEEDPLGKLSNYDGRWWLPGFVEPTGGGLVGSQPPWPEGGWILSEQAVGSTDWQTFRLVIAPDSMEFYRGEDVLITFPLPREAEAPATAPLYRYFDSLRALRIFMRGNDLAYLSNLRITATSP
ncbi:MAG: hypothetical protein AAGC55_04740 [Myxococcota bacterium]